MGGGKPLKDGPSELSGGIDLADLWGNILGKISLLVNAQTFQTWFEPMKIATFVDSLIVIEGPNPFFIDWVAEHHIDKISMAAEEILGRAITVEFTAAGSHERAKSSAPPPSPPKKEEGRIEPPLNKNLNRRYTFGEFVVGACNRLTHAAASAVAENPASAYNPLFIYGGAGLGKTHLIQAIGNYAITHHSSLRVSYVSAETFMNELIYAIQTGSTLKFKERYRNTDILLIDDVHFLAGKESTQEEFFFTFNALHDANKQIVVTSDRPPKEIPTLQDRLTTRFEWGLITDIHPPDLETRIAILRRKVRKENIEIPDDVINLIAENVKTNIRALEGSLIRLLASSSLTRQEINCEMAERTLDGIIKNLKPTPVTIESIQKRVSETYGISVAKIKSSSRIKNIVLARQIAIFLSREITDKSLVEIGKNFGGRDHSTVLHAIKKINKSLSKDPSLEKEIQILRGKLSE
ncbi:MAG TPA: chromosomal replication initiator protein DnaA [Candidatus Krumholzibacteriaceae bacterium]|nr:chromosomal replication initiator protein DnaA [Candidatus Krumholzibacteriaceae bacterium]